MSPKARPITNLDIRCAEAGWRLANIEGMEEKVLNDGLAVLEEQGVYAMFLYIKARYRKVAEDFEECCVNLLREVFSDKMPANADALEIARRLADGLDDLLFARELLRNALGYARYHVKARKG